MAGNEVILLNRGCMGEPYVIENVCFVGSDESVDITIEQGRIADVRSSEKSVASFKNVDHSRLVGLPHALHAVVVHAGAA